MPASNSPIVPELVVFQTVKAALQVLRENWELYKNDEQRSFIYRCLGAFNGLQRYDMLQQAKAVFFRPINANEPRYVDVSMGFDTDRIQKKMPTVHIIMQNENPKDNSLGLGSGNFDPEFYEDAIDPQDPESATIGKYSPNNSRRFTQQLNLLISGDNSNEKILIYHVLKTIMISYIPYLNELGFENVEFSGGDVQINTEVAGNIYMRNLIMKHDYDLISPSLEEYEFARQIFFTITVLNDG